MIGYILSRAYHPCLPVELHRDPPYVDVRIGGNALLQGKLQGQPFLADTLRKLSSLTTCTFSRSSSFRSDVLPDLACTSMLLLGVMLVFDSALIGKKIGWLPVICNCALCQYACHGFAGQEPCGEQSCERNSAGRSWSSSDCDAGQWCSQALHRPGQAGVMQEQPAASVQEATWEQLHRLVPEQNAEEQRSRHWLQRLPTQCLQQKAARNSFKLGKLLQM